MMASRPLFPFVRQRFRHELIEAAGDVCLVARTNLVTDHLHYEVVVLQHEAERHWPNGYVTPAHARYPGDEEWGTAGWTYPTRPEADQKYRSLGESKAQTGGSGARGRVTA